MTDYKTMRVPREAWEDAKAAKGDEETWGEYLRRCGDNPPEVRQYVEATDEQRPVTLDATEYGKIADELEDRLR